MNTPLVKHINVVGCICDAGASTTHQASQRVEQRKTAGQANKLLFEFYLDMVEPNINEKKLMKRTLYIVKGTLSR
jgi:hypothetical protein